MNQAQRILEIVEEKGILRPQDLKKFGIARSRIYRLFEKGMLKKIGRGLYVLPDAEPTTNHTIAQVCKRIPSGVICLFSALQYHEITTQQPHRVWIALSRKSWKPVIKDLPINIVWFSDGPSLRAGIEIHNVEGVSVKVYNPAKTVADCFKYRNKIGLDVALEALRECRRANKCTNDDLWHYAKICHVSNVMRPYMEVLS